MRYSFLEAQASLGLAMSVIQSAVLSFCLTLSFQGIKYKSKSFNVIQLQTASSIGIQRHLMSLNVILCHSMTFTKDSARIFICFIMTLTSL